MRVLVVDDSAFHRLSLATALREFASISTVETASSGTEALRILGRADFDLVTLDIEMPGIDGFAVLRWIMANKPVPVLIVSEGANNRSVMAALDLGAFEVMGKPSPRAGGREDWRGHLGRALETATQLHLDTLRARAASTYLGPEIRDVSPVTRQESAEESFLRMSRAGIAIASSTGGPPALRELLQAFRRRPVIVGIAQHMPPPFTKSLAARLASTTGWAVREARNGEIAQPGEVLLAPGGQHLSFQLSGNDVIAIVSDDGRGARWCPSGDILLSSAAEVFGSAAVGIVLTGMGNDGSDGASRIAAAGGKVLVESRDTAVVYGMPEAASRRVPSAPRLALPKLAEELNQLFPVDTLATPI